MITTYFRYIYSMKHTYLLLLIVLVWSCNEKQPKETQQESTAEVVTEAPETAKVENDLVKVYDYEGLEAAVFNKDNDTTYVVNFWATWCKPCIKEMPYFEQIGADYKDQNVKVVFVSLDFPNYLEPKVIPFIAKNNIQSEVVLLDDTDANTWIPKVSTEWSGAIPATVIYKGSNSKFYERSFTYEELETEVKSIL